MKGLTKWSFERYTPAVCASKNGVYIHRIVPSTNEIVLYWDGGVRCQAYYRPKGSEGAWQTSEYCDAPCCLTALPTESEWEFYLLSEDGRKSEVGYARAGTAPGTVVNYLHPDDKKYAFSGSCLCSPCLLCHPDGYYLASMDVFANAAPQNLTLIFRSDDRGETWYHYSELFPCEWGTLFYHRGDVYMLSVSTEYGDMLIGRSTDGGKTWPMPTVIHRGAGRQSVPGWHKSSGKVLEHGGRLWCAYDFGAHKAGGHASCLISADVNADLTAPESWSITEPLRYDPNWEGACVGDDRGFIEGTPVVGPDGSLYNFLRYNMHRGTPNYGYAGMLRATPQEPERMLEFAKFTPFPGNHSKFDVVWDAQSKRYYSIVSRIRNADCAGDRNLLSLVASTDLSNWSTLCDLIDYTDHDPALYGFQYVSFHVEGDDLVYLCRTAVNGARTFHDNNYVTFHRIKHFRELNCPCL